METAYNESLLNRLLAKIQFTESCWLWTACKSRLGYGRIRMRGKLLSAHRVLYEICNGSIPAELEMDHLCRVRHCVNPDHLEPVTHRVNVKRSDHSTHRNRVKTHCLRGHPFSEDNLYFDRGARLCRTCILAKRRRYYQEHGAEVRARVLRYYNTHLSKAARSSRRT